MTALLCSGVGGSAFSSYQGASITVLFPLVSNDSILLPNPAQKYVEQSLDFGISEGQI